jgi:hypothetical protein
LENYSNELALSHYNKKLNKKVLEHWIIYTKISKRKNLLEKQADWFNKMRLKFYGFKLWQQKYVEIVEDNERNNKAVIHWAWQLEKKCFLNWLLYINQRKLKKKRYNDAISDRHNEILKSSLKCLIVYANDSRERRHKQLLNLKQRKITIENQLEYKYYHRWKEIYKKNHQKKLKINSLYDKVDDFQNRISSNSYLPTVVTNGKQTPILAFTDIPAIRVTNRPQPRKPAFLLDSINADVSTASSNETGGKSFENFSILSMVRPKIVVESEPEKPVLLLKDAKPVLLPPSAFSVLSETKIVNSFDHTKTLSRCSSVTTTFDTEIHQELTLLKLNNENFVKKNEESYNLMKLKERLENLAISKDKLKYGMIV